MCRGWCRPRRRPRKSRISRPRGDVHQTLRGDECHGRSWPSDIRHAYLVASVTFRVGKDRHTFVPSIRRVERVRRTEAAHAIQTEQRERAREARDDGSGQISDPLVLVDHRDARRSAPSSPRVAEGSFPPIVAPIRDPAMRIATGTIGTLSAPVGTIRLPPTSLRDDVHDRQANSPRTSGSCDRRCSDVSSVAFRSVTATIRDAGAERRSLTCVPIRSAPGRETRHPPLTKGSPELPVALIRSPAGSRSGSGSGWSHT